MSSPGTRQVGPADVLSAFEAFAQRLELPLNRRMESLPEAILVEQQAGVELVSMSDIKAQLDDVLERLDER